jgi:hypothetical protein
MRRSVLFLIVVTALLASIATPAWAQRMPFERSFHVAGPTILDVSTDRGKIDVTVGDQDHVVIIGTVTIRVGWDVPANAADLARKVADHPPVEQDGHTVRLRSPADDAERRAVNVSYHVRVPRDTQVRTVSDSGATTVEGVVGSVVVQTQSGSIDLRRLGGPADVKTGSGAVNIDNVAGALTVTTASSAFTGRSLHAGLRVRTGSGAIDAVLAGIGDVDVETASSGIVLRGINGGLTASTQSGKVTVQGTPHRPWSVSTGSSSIDVTMALAPGVNVEATSRSGSVKVTGVSLQGSVTKGRAAGTIGGGGPLVRLTSGSGSIRIGGS